MMMMVVLVVRGVVMAVRAFDWCQNQ